jgi:hypothetical protein
MERQQENEESAMQKGRLWMLTLIAMTMLTTVLMAQDKKPHGHHRLQPSLDAQP